MSAADTEPVDGFIERTYTLPGVAPAALELQDRYGVNVPVLLAAIWAAGARETDDEAVIWRLHDAGATLTDDVVLPLRRVRMRLRDEVANVPATTVRDLHDAVLRAEIETERAQLQLFRTLTDHEGGRAPAGADAERIARHLVAAATTVPFELDQASARLMVQIVAASLPGTDAIADEIVRRLLDPPDRSHP